MSKEKSVKMLTVGWTLGAESEGGKKIGGSKVHRWGAEGRQWASVDCDCGWMGPPCPELELPSSCPQCDYQFGTEEA
jgi:hypothetical protein